MKPNAFIRGIAFLLVPTIAANSVNCPAAVIDPTLWHSATGMIPSQFGREALAGKLASSTRNHWHGPLWFWTREFLQSELGEHNIPLKQSIYGDGISRRESLRRIGVGASVILGILAAGPGRAQQTNPVATPVTLPPEARRVDPSNIHQMNYVSRFVEGIRSVLLNGEEAVYNGLGIPPRIKIFAYHNWTISPEGAKLLAPGNDKVQNFLTKISIGFFGASGSKFLRRRWWQWTTLPLWPFVPRLGRRPQIGLDFSDTTLSYGGRKLFERSEGENFLLTPESQSLYSPEGYGVYLLEDFDQLRLRSPELGDRLLFATPDGLFIVKRVRFSIRAISEGYLFIDYSTLVDKTFKEEPNPLLTPLTYPEHNRPPVEIFKGLLSFARSRIPGLNEALEDKRMDLAFRVLRKITIEDPAYPSDFPMDAKTQIIGIPSPSKGGHDQSLFLEVEISESSVRHLGRNVVATLHELAHVAEAHKRADELLHDSSRTFPRDELEVNTYNTSVHLLEDIARMPEVRAANPAFWDELTRPGGFIDQERNLLAYWQERLRGTEQRQPLRPLGAAVIPPNKPRAASETDGTRPKVENTIESNPPANPSPDQTAGDDLRLLSSLMFPFHNAQARRAWFVGSLWLMTGAGWLANLGYRVSMGHRMVHGQDPYPRFEVIAMFNRGAVIAAVIAVVVIGPAFLLSHYLAPVIGMGWAGLTAHLMPLFGLAYANRLDWRDIFHPPWNLLIRRAYWKAAVITWVAFALSLIPAIPLLKILMNDGLSQASLWKGVFADLPHLVLFIVFCFTSVAVYHVTCYVFSQAYLESQQHTSENRDRKAEVPGMTRLGRWSQAAALTAILFLGAILLLRPTDAVILSSYVWERQLSELSSAIKSFDALADDASPKFEEEVAPRAFAHPSYKDRLEPLVEAKRQEIERALERDWTLSSERRASIFQYLQRAKVSAYAEGSESVTISLEGTFQGDPSRGERHPESWTVLLSRRPPHVTMHVESMNPQSRSNTIEEMEGPEAYVFLRAVTHQSDDERAVAAFLALLNNRLDPSIVGLIAQIDPLALNSNAMQRGNTAGSQPPERAPINPLIPRPWAWLFILGVPLLDRKGEDHPALGPPQVPAEPAGREQLRKIVHEAKQEGFSPADLADNVTSPIEGMGSLEALTRCLAGEREVSKEFVDDFADAHNVLRREAFQGLTPNRRPDDLMSSLEHTPKKKAEGSQRGRGRNPFSSDEKARSLAARAARFKEKIFSAIANLQADGQAYTREAVARELGVQYNSFLSGTNRLGIVLAELPFQSEERKITRQGIDDAIEALRRANIHTSMKALGERMQVHWSSIWRYARRHNMNLKAMGVSKRRLVKLVQLNKLLQYVKAIQKILSTKDSLDRLSMLNQAKQLAIELTDALIKIRTEHPEWITYLGLRRIYIDVEKVKNDLEKPGDADPALLRTTIDRIADALKKRVATQERDLTQGHPPRGSFWDRTRPPQVTPEAVAPLVQTPTRGEALANVGRELNWFPRPSSLTKYLDRNGITTPWRHAKKPGASFDPNIIIHGIKLGELQAIVSGTTSIHDFMDRLRERNVVMSKGAVLYYMREYRLTAPWRRTRSQHASPLVPPLPKDPKGIAVVALIAMTGLLSIGLLALLWPLLHHAAMAHGHLLIHAHDWNLAFLFPVGVLLLDRKDDENPSAGPFAEFAGRTRDVRVSVQLTDAARTKLRRGGFRRPIDVYSSDHMLGGVLVRGMGLDADTVKTMSLRVNGNPAALSDRLQNGDRVALDAEIQFLNFTAITVPRQADRGKQTTTQFIEVTLNPRHAENAKLRKLLPPEYRPREGRVLKLVTLFSDPPEVVAFVVELEGGKRFVADFMGEPFLSDYLFGTQAARGQVMENIVKSYTSQRADFFISEKGNRVQLIIRRRDKSSDPDKTRRGWVVDLWPVTMALIFLASLSAFSAMQSMLTGSWGKALTLWAAILIVGSIGALWNHPPQRSLARLAA